MERLIQQMKFIMEIDKLKQVYRQSYISDGTRHENDTEHSWSLAMMCMLFSEYSPEKVDVLKAMKMVLIHDIVEIDAGDTYAYDSVGNATKRQREEKAADRIFNILPEDQAVEMRELWEEFEAGESIEAKYAITMDNPTPVEYVVLESYAFSRATASVFQLGELGGIIKYHFHRKVWT